MELDVHEETRHGEHGAVYICYLLGEGITLGSSEQVDVFDVIPGHGGIGGKVE